MPKRKTIPKSSTKDIFLSIVFVTAIVIGFSMIWAVEYAYATNGETPALLYESDTSTQFPTIVYGDEYPAKHWDSITPMYGFVTSPGGDYLQYNKAPVYLGNSTWGFSVNGTTHPKSIVLGIVDLPDLDQWMITRVKTNITLNGDADLIVSVHLNGLLNPTQLSTGTPGIRPYFNPTAGGLTTLAIDETVSLADALALHDMTQGRPEKYLHISIQDANDDGFGAFGFEFSIEIYGTPISGWSVSDSLTLALGLGVVLNGVVMVYMTDMVDIGGAVRDLPKKVKRRGR